MAFGIKKISELAAATSAALADILVIVQGGVTKKISISSLGKSTPTADSLALRNTTGQTQVATPSTADDAANKSYVDNAGGVAASFVPGATVDNVTTFGKVYKIAGAAPTGTESGTDVTDGYQSTELTFNFNTTNPLSGTKDYQMTNRVTGMTGAGVYWDFTLDPAFRTIPLQITYPYTNQNADSLWKTFIIAYSDAYITPVAVIPISDPDLRTAVDAAQFFATFLPTTYKYYRLYIHATTSGTIGHKLNIDNLGVSKQSSMNGAAISEWKPYTPTFSSGFGTPTGIDFRYRRVGSSIDIIGRFVAGVVASSVGLIGFPTGLSASDSTAKVQGSWRRGNANATTAKRGTFVWAPGDTSFAISNDADSPALNPASGTNVNSLIANSESVFVELHGIPIAQWTTNVNLVTDFTEFRSHNGTTEETGIQGSLMLTTTPAGTAETFTLSYTNIGATDLFIVETQKGGVGPWTTTADLIDSLRFDGTNFIGCGVYYDGSSVKLVRGKYRNGTTNLWSVITAGTRWRVRKVSNGNMAEVPPVVRAEYNTSAGQALTSVLTPINYGTKVEDTHSAVSNPTTNWTFTAPIPGVYSLTVSILGSSLSYSAGAYLSFSPFLSTVQKGSLVEPYGPAISSYVGTYNATKTFRMLAGDTLQLKGSRGSQATDGSLHANGAYNWIQITRIGP